MTRTAPYLFHCNDLPPTLKLVLNRLSNTDDNTYLVLVGL